MMDEIRSERRAEIGAGLSQVEARIRAACEGAGRARDEVTLIVVTKFFPASDIEILCELGVRDIGESRDQEARAKVADVATRLGDRTPRIHFIGQLQRNKAASVAGYADVVHSLDRDRLARALDAGASRAGRSLDVLLQIDLDSSPDPGRGGVRPDEVPALAGQLSAYPNLRLRGVMAVAPRGGDTDEAFARLATVHRELSVAYPDAVMVSAGMSGDLEAAIAHGATHLRVGSAILGSRAPHR